MKKFFVPLLIVGGFFTTSCDKNFDIAQVIQKRSELYKEKNKLISNDDPYSVKFNPVTPKYKLETREIIEDFYNNRINRGGFWGQFLVAKNGQIIFEDYQGYANYQKKEKINDSTPMHVASVGKVFTGVTVLRLIQKGKLSLDQKVQSILPNFPYEDITVRLLLNHRSGLPYYGHFTSKAGVWNNKVTLTNTDVLNLLTTKAIKLDFRPNTRFTYSNTNYVILALIVEKITEKSFQNAMKELVLEPLKMNNTFVLENLENKYNLTQSYYANNQIMRWDYLDGTYGDKNIYTTARDMLKLDKALYSDAFLSKILKEQMYKGYSYEKAGENNYGLAIRMIEPKNGGNLYTFHNGWWRGNRTSYVTLRKDTITIICFNNHNSQLAYKTKELAPRLGNYPFIEIND
ncbi:beta-lactamase family protein [Flavobacterium sp. CBA20B-1]|uniref:serine hydrolase domain-containing protein n=1 Tax=unclassified Flavobacterium TaxID=196869 RepID=UPI00222405A9|nr:MULTISPECIES: serine hydrolase domain-containing protein [unclassified Flavobacterium]WCM42654.1 beta-lactamase family protein [Flavobacterium sp. CBA20B-1]